MFKGKKKKNAHKKSERVFEPLHRFHQQRREYYTSTVCHGFCCGLGKVNRPHFRQQRMPSLSCHHPSLLVQSAPTPGLIHQLCSLLLEPQQGPSAQVPSTLRTTVTAPPQRNRSLEAGSAAKRLGFQLWNFAHPSLPSFIRKFRNKILIFNGPSNRSVLLQTKEKLLLAALQSFEGKRCKKTKNKTGSCFLPYWLDCTDSSFGRQR